jgi:hypothetical protein
MEDSKKVENVAVKKTAINPRSGDLRDAPIL